ncbi:MAG: hypothetical protein M1282_13965, partial [Chloroflexi bacterium]|nr:hypothetical protein [Chloroflexota bacterium]
ELVVPLPSKTVKFNWFHLASNKWKVWRIVNSAIILISLFLPWGVAEGPSHDYKNDLIWNGIQIVQWDNILVPALLSNPELQLPLSARITLITGLTTEFVGLAAVLAYCILNLILGMFINKLVGKPVWNILAFCLIVFGGIGLWYILTKNLSWWWQSLLDSLWGYWLIWIGLLSSIVLEISYFVSKRK